MAEDCSCNKTSCSGCESEGNCSQTPKGPESFLEPLNAASSIKKVIGVASGKGGVGKSFVTASLASAMTRAGYKVGILDSDITGPSIPKMYDVHGPAVGTENGILPIPAKDGTKIMSINLLVNDEESPVVWRGPILAGTVKQFWSEVCWGELDYLFVDMPPGTGDVPLTVFQSLPLDGIVIVTSPQDLVELIVKKCFNMATMMNIPVLGVVENYSYFECPHCGEKISVFGESNIDATAKELDIEVLAKLPMNPDYAKAADDGVFETLEVGGLEKALEKVKAL
ncbi:MAG: Mrp/NBP35 family ATP-binding protein [Eubacterium sp.]|nr:Mrp/NBP35 family ATP-binding protein [Eubacterium sp.]